MFLWFYGSYYFRYFAYVWLTLYLPQTVATCWETLQWKWQLLQHLQQQFWRFFGVFGALYSFLALKIGMHIIAVNFYCFFVMARIQDITENETSEHLSNSHLILCRRARRAVCSNRRLYEYLFYREIENSINKLNTTACLL